MKVLDVGVFVLSVVLIVVCFGQSLIDLFKNSWGCFVPHSFLEAFPFASSLTIMYGGIDKYSGDITFQKRNTEVDAELRVFCRIES